MPHPEIEVDGGGMVYVDQFPVRDCNFRLYFLTHFHADHMVGLDGDWNGGPIYTSPISAALLVHQWPSLKELVHAIPLEEPKMINVGSKGSETTISVTLIDVNHCPGSVMFLFEFPDKLIFSMGDGRVGNESEGGISSLDSLRGFMHGKHVDTLYIDSLFAKAYMEFPTSADVERMILAKLEGIVEDNPNAHVFFLIFCSGHEFYFSAVYERFKSRIHVNEKYLDEITAIHDADSQEVDPKILIAGADIPEDIRFHAIHNNYDNDHMDVNTGNNGGVNEYLGNLLKKEPTAEVFCIRTVAGTFEEALRTDAQAKAKTKRFFSEPDVTRKGNVTTYKFLCSLHSSAPELVDIVKVLRPRKIVPNENGKDVAKTEFLEHLRAIAKQVEVDGDGEAAEDSLSLSRDAGADIRPFSALSGGRISRNGVSPMAQVNSYGDHWRTPNLASIMSAQRPYMDSGYAFSTPTPLAPGNGKGPRLSVTPRNAGLIEHEREKGGIGGIDIEIVEPTVRSKNKKRKSDDGIRLPDMPVDMDKELEAMDAFDSAQFAIHFAKSALNRCK